MTKSTRFLTAADPDGPEIKIPVATIEGRTDGPTMLIVAGVHGSEYTGLEAVRRLHHTVDADELSGRLITVPCFGLPAFYGFATHVSPIDGLNPGREFPGDPNGSHTQRAAHLLWTNLVEVADAVVDVHGGDLEEDLTEYVQVNLTGNSELDDRALRPGQGIRFRAPRHVTGPERASPRQGGLFSMAAAAGKLGVLTEAGSHGILDLDLATWYHDRLLDGLRGFGMLPGARRRRRHDPAVPLRRRLRPGRGLLVPLGAQGRPSRRGPAGGDDA